MWQTLVVHKEINSAMIGSPTEAKKVLSMNECEAIKITGSNKTKMLSRKLGFISRVSSDEKFNGLQVKSFNVLPNNQPEINMAGMEIIMPSPKVVPISAPGK